MGSMKILTNAIDIKVELMTNGPMVATITKYNDFDTLTTLVYTKGSSATFVGFTQVRLVGWTTTGPDTYWIVEYSKAGWGSSGQAQIKAGDIGVDSLVVGCTPV